MMELDVRLWVRPVAKIRSLMLSALMGNETCSIHPLGRTLETDEER